ncbi:hypothetical protein [Nocardia sp. NBC_00511]|uniref:hypothetical protein n=1 Tax=Nocardia sp. NBC_00511 TaxID=2903591 RepID=UPI0030E0234D
MKPNRYIPSVPMDNVGVLEIPDETAELSRYFHTNPHHGKHSDQMTRELRQVAAETRKRLLNGCDVEDQWWRSHFLREARAQLN